MRGVFDSVLVRGLLIVFCALAILSPAGAFASADTGHLKGFVKIREGRELYVDYIRPAAGRPTIVIINGLTYSTSSWDSFTYALYGDGLGILRYDPMGQGRTLLKYAPATAAFDYKEQVDDLRLLLDKLKITAPAHFVGLSYGGALGMYFSTLYPERVASLILMAPFVAPIEGQDQWIKMQVSQTRVMNPLNPATDDELYDYFLKLIVYSTYPYAEPIVLENPYKLEATFRLVQGVRKFLAKDVVAKLPNDKVHLMIARKDQYLENSVHDAFWASLKPRTKGSRIYIEGSEHKIPEAVPRFAAAWVKLIANGDARLQHDTTWVGVPWNGTAASDSTKIEHLGWE